jgi:hypothetical protein
MPSGLFDMLARCAHSQSPFGWSTFRFVVVRARLRRLAIISCVP